MTEEGAKEGEREKCDKEIEKWTERWDKSKERIRGGNGKGKKAAL